MRILFKRDESAESLNYCTTVLVVSKLSISAQYLVLVISTVVVLIIYCIGFKMSLPNKSVTQANTIFGLILLVGPSTNDR